MILADARWWSLSALLMAGVLVGEMSASEAGHPEPESRRKIIMNGNDEARLNGYLHGESKYNVLPVPAPLNRPLAIAFVSSHLPSALDPDTAAKLSRLAIYYDLRDTSDGFLQLMRPVPSPTQNVARTVAAIAALAWIGDGAQVAAARERYVELLRREDVEAVRETLLGGAYALGPAEGSGTLQRAVADAAADLRSKISTARTNQGGTVENLETRLDRLEEFSVREIKALDRANALRQSVLGETNSASQIAILVALYLEAHPQGTRRLSEWAAFRLVRMSVGADVGAAFLEAAARHERIDKTRQKELDLVRARALRGAAFFGMVLSAEALEWLRARPDNGTDMLALRPDWEYPPPHQH